MASNLPPQDETERLINSARDVEILPDLPRRPLSDGPLWRAIDAVGRFALPVGLVCVVIGFAVSSIGPEWAWASLLYSVTLLLLLIYIPALFRSNARRQEADYRAAREKQERARAEIARMVLEQSRREEKKTTDEPK